MPNPYFSLITDPVGNRMKNNQDDVFRVKDRLQSTGYMEKEKEPNGYITQDMNKAIWKFQKEKGLKMDGFMLPGGETERALNQENVSLAMLRPKWLNALPVNDVEGRKEAILQNLPARFDVRETYGLNRKKSIFEQDRFSTVKTYDDLISKNSSKEKIDPDIVRAIMHMETTHGYYDKVLEPFDLNKTIRPMNIHSVFWQDLGYSREDLEIPEKNILVGIRLLKAIQDRIPHANVSQIATVYNSLGSQEVKEYGAQVERIYKERSWDKRK